ncbi:MAG: tRNA (adenosine(37)-N6)-dimethylallyltransferase MiaA, partial [Selenomonas sp.]|nr:tRNA (adenosine(37)-N6)-dimethylallyltransferase MiaA [Selenomonas sp.]
MTNKEKLIVILGPTAVGKTDLSIELAKKIDTEIISGDSMLFYRGFDIGSAKPALAERQGIVHHLVDNLEPWENFNVTDFVREAKRLIRELNAQGKIPIIAGGTGLYIKALLEGYEF